jgi:hypothetical protein
MCLNAAGMGLMARPGLIEEDQMTSSKKILRTGAVAAVMVALFAVFAFRAAEWTSGLNSGFIVYGQSSTGSTGGTGSTGSTGSTGGTTGGSPNSKAIPQIAVGAFDNSTHYGTIIEIINPNASAITVSGNFYNEDGTASTLPFATNMTSQPMFIGSFTNFNLPAGSILVLSTGTTSATTPKNGTTNWGLISANNTISVSSFFELRRRGDDALYSRVGIASSSPNMSSFLIPRIREKQSADSNSEEIDTGFAVVNTGSKTATITAKLIDANGNTIATASFPLAPNNHKAAIVSSGFMFLTGEASGRQYQYMLFSSDQPTIAAAAIAFEGGNLTSFPVDPL